MSLGEILDRTAQLYRTNFLLFIGISAVNAGVVMIIDIGQIGITEFFQHRHMTAQLPWESLAFLAVVFPILVAFGLLSVAANNRAVAWLNLGCPASIRGAYASILPRFWRLIWLTIIVMFFVYTPFLIICGGYFGFLFAYVRPRHLFAAGGGANNSAGFAVLGIVSFVFFILLLGALIYAIFMGLRYSLAVPACVVEDVSARKAIRRSIELSKDSRGRIFLLVLLILAIQIGIAGLTQVFFVVLAFKHKFILPVGIQILQQVVAFATNSFIGPMYATGFTLFYYDQRIRKEGFDIEWMMEAAGMTPAALPVEAEAAPAESEAAQAPSEPQNPLPQSENLPVQPEPESIAAASPLPEPHEDEAPLSEPPPDHSNG
jgi:hypothetical protein